MKKDIIKETVEESKLESNNHELCLSSKAYNQLLDITEKNIKKTIAKEVTEHRERVVITCEENCFCWDIERLCLEDSNA